MAKRLDKGSSDPAPDAGVAPGTPEFVDASDFVKSFGETIESALDPKSWHAGFDLEGALTRFDAEVSDAIEQEHRVRPYIRNKILPQISKVAGAPPEAGVFRLTRDQIDHAFRRVLYVGAAEAADGTSSPFRTLPLTVIQIGVALVSYHGEKGTWSHRLFHRDLRQASNEGDLEKEVVELLERRHGRSSAGVKKDVKNLSELAQRGIMAYMERMLLLEKSSAPWRIGHGHALPYELITGAGLVDEHGMPLLNMSLDVLEKLLLGHARAVFVPSDTNDALLQTIGQALEPGEVAIIDTIERERLRIVDEGHYKVESRDRARRFVQEVGSQWLVGVYRASWFAPPNVFYAHREHVEHAAAVVMADSLLQDHRGFPMLIDLADVSVRAAVGADTFQGLLADAYARRGEPFRYLPERSTR